MVSLVDADSIVHKIGFAIEDKVIWNEQEIEAGLETEPEVSYYTNMPQLFKTLDMQVENILWATGTDDVLLVFTGRGNFRYDLPIGYKENRADFRKPLGYNEMIEYLMTNYNSYMAEGMEADDYVVYLKTTYPDDYVLCAVDKDVLYQSEGVHYNYNKDIEVEVTKEEAVKYAYLQTLMGDVTDGYKGCKGIGVVNATKILQDCETEEEMWDAVVTTFEKKGHPYEDALNTMRLANMHQFDGTKIVLWEPPTASN